MSSVDFADQLRRQLLFLKNSCDLYDQGCLEEAIRIATTLRVIGHTTGSSVSVLTHLKADSSCNLLSTALAEPFRRDAYALVTIGFISRNHSVPLLATPKLAGAKHQRFIPFNDWWNDESVISAGSAGIVTRRELVLWAANKDGGAHVDDRLTARYEAVIAGAGLSVKLKENDDGKIPEAEQAEMPVKNLHFATLRQIAHEVLNSAELLALANPPLTPTVAQTPDGAGKRVDLQVVEILHHPDEGIIAGEFHVWPQATAEKPSA